MINGLKGLDGLILISRIEKDVEREKIKSNNY